jgi:hypothetical protein
MIISPIVFQLLIDHCKIGTRTLELQVRYDTHILGGIEFNIQRSPGASMMEN